MFEGRKARKLGIKDLGVASKRPKIDGPGLVYKPWRHASCGGKLREGMDLKTGTDIFIWCPKCKRIVIRGYIKSRI